jgi:hypothetical protein
MYHIVINTKGVLLVFFILFCMFVCEKIYASDNDSAHESPKRPRISPLTQHLEDITQPQQTAQDSYDYFQNNYDDYVIDSDDDVPDRWNDNKQDNRAEHSVFDRNVRAEQDREYEELIATYHQRKLEQEMREAREYLDAERYHEQIEGTLMLAEDHYSLKHINTPPPLTPAQRRAFNAAAFEKKFRK